MKKLLSGIFTLALVLMCFPVSAFASESHSAEEVIPLEEYYASMKSLYAEYGVIYEILDFDEDYIFTREFLNEQLTNTREKLEASVSQTTVSVVTNGTTSVDRVGGIEPFALMPYDYSATQYVTLLSPSGMGSAQFAITLTATADAQYDTFLNIKNYTCKQNGAYVNFKSWTETSKSHKLSNGNKNCTVTFVGDLTIEYTEPTTGILAGYTSTHEFNCNFTA